MPQKNSVVGGRCPPYKLTRSPQGFEAALQVAAAHQYLNARLRILEALRLRGVEVLDVEPPALPVALVNRYLDIKHSGRL